MNKETCPGMERFFCVGVVEKQTRNWATALFCDIHYGEKSCMLTKTPSRTEKTHRERARLDRRHKNDLNIDSNIIKDCLIIKSQVGSQVLGFQTGKETFPVTPLRNQEMLINKTMDYTTEINASRDKFFNAMRNSEVGICAR